MIRHAYLLVLGIAALAQPTARDVGFVVNVSGQWELLQDGTKRALKPQQVLRSGDLLQKDDQAASSAVIYAVYSSGRLQTVTSTTTVSDAPGSSTWTRILQLIQQRFDTAFISASVRGGEPFNDAVVAARGDATDLSPVFAGSTAYQVDAYRIVSGKPADAPTARARIGRASAATFPPLGVGLYQLIISGSGAGATGYAWVFVSPPDRYEDALRTFDTLRRVDANAGADLRVAAKALGRGYLMVLDDERAGR